MNDRLNLWVRRLYNFDIYSDFSDDHQVWKQGLDARGLLKRDILEAGFTDDEKEEILRRVGEIWEESYLRSRAKYPSMVEHPLWNEGDGPDRKQFVKSYLGMTSE